VNDGSHTDERVKVTGAQFHALVNSPDGAGRYFMHLDNIVIECSEEEYKKWKAAKNHSDYLWGFESGAAVVPLDAVLSADGGSDDGEVDEVITGQDVTADENHNTEKMAFDNIEIESLRAAVSTLPGEDKWLIERLFLGDRRVAQREIAATLGISQQAVAKRKAKVLATLKARMEGQDCANV